MRWLAFALLMALPVVAAPPPSVVNLSWGTPAGVQPDDVLKLEWAGGFSLFGPYETGGTVEGFPLGVAQPVSLYRVKPTGEETQVGTIYIANLIAHFEEANTPKGPWVEGPQARILMVRAHPKGFVRVRLQMVSESQ